MRATAKVFYTPEEYTAAKSANLVSYLQCMGYGLDRIAGGYKGKTHDSMIIRDDGRWYWNSRGIGGKSPIELLKHILIDDYGYSDEITAAIEAIKRLAGMNGVISYETPVSRAKHESVSETAPPGPFIMPKAYKSASYAMAYLCKTRGLDAEIVMDLIKSKRIYETSEKWNKETKKFEPGKFHNAVFVGYDKNNVPKNGFMRGTFSAEKSPFKSEVYNSDKSYSFTLPGCAHSGRVFCFEAAIDAISHASLYKRYGLDWRQDSRIALGGTSFLGLNRFLEDNPDVRRITVCLDNDETGLRRGKKLAQEFTERGYTVDFEYSASKDYNLDLLNDLKAEQEERARDNEQDKESDFEFEPDD